MLQEMKQTGAPVPGGGLPSMTLGAYLAEAGKALRMGIPRAWVGAVVLEARTTNAGMSLELVEPSSDEVQDGRPATSAMAACAAWSGRRPEPRSSRRMG